MPGKRPRDRESSRSVLRSREENRKSLLATITGTSKRLSHLTPTLNSLYPRLPQRSMVSDQPVTDMYRLPTVKQER